MNLSSLEPAWSVRGLQGDVRYRLSALAVNSKGRSAAAALDPLLFTDPEKHTGGESSVGLGGAVCAGGAGAGALVALAAALAVRRQRRRRRAARAKPPPPRAEADPARKHADQHDDAEPDLIPNNYCEASGATDAAASPALSAPTCNGPGAPWTWGARVAGCGGRGAARALGRSVSSAGSLRAAPDLNVDAIKEKLLDHRIPESCV